MDKVIFKALSGEQTAREPIGDHPDYPHSPYLRVYPFLGEAWQPGSLQSAVLEVNGHATCALGT